MFILKRYIGTMTCLQCCYAAQILSLALFMILTSGAIERYHLEPDPPCAIYFGKEKVGPSRVASVLAYYIFCFPKAT